VQEEIWSTGLSISTNVEPQMRAVWTEPAVCIGLAEQDDVPERNTVVQKELKLKRLAADPDVTLQAALVI